MYAGNQNNVSNHQRKEVLEELSKAATEENFLPHLKKKIDQCIKKLYYVVSHGVRKQVSTASDSFCSHFQTYFPCSSSFPDTPDILRLNM